MAELAQRVDKRWRARLASGDPLEASLQREQVCSRCLLIGPGCGLLVPDLWPQRDVWVA